VSKPECPYCGATEGLRVKSNGAGFEAPEFTCEGCFTGTDDGPCFDDLPEVSDEMIDIRRWNDRMGMGTRS